MKIQQNQFRGATSFQAIIGAALFWSWVDMLLFSPIMLLPFDIPDYYYTTMFIITVLVGCIGLVCAARNPEKARKALSSQKILFFFSGAVVLGCSALLGGFSLQLMVLVVLGSIGNGICFAAGLIAWGSVCATQGIKTAGIHISAAFALGVGFDLIIMSLQPPIAALLVPFLFVISFTVLDFYHRRPRTQESDYSAGLSSQSFIDWSRLIKVKHSWFGLSRNILISFILFGLALGFMEQSGLFGGAGLANAQLFHLVRGATSLILFMGFAFLGWKAHIVFRVGMAAMIAGFMTMSFALQIPGLNEVSRAIVAAGYACFDIMAWCILSELAYCTKTPSESTIGAGRSLIHFGVAMGVLLGALLPFAQLPETLNTVVITSVGYFLVIALILIIDDHHGLWSLLKYGSTYSLNDVVVSSREKAIMVADEYSLTGREEDTLEYLLSGRSAPYIAECLGISESTVKSHIKHIYEKTSVHNRQELLDLAEENEFSA